MALNGIDTSSYQAGLNVAGIAADFIIAKATQGVSYVNPVCDTHIQQAIASGKKFGFYHFCDFGDPISEARYFYTNTQGYVGKGIPVLDYEGVGANNPDWVKSFCDTYFQLSGVRPIIYMSESVVNSFDWSAVIAGNYGLWVAKYWDNNPQYNYVQESGQPAPNVNWGDTGYVLWQWTSAGRLDGYNANLDCDIFYGDGNTWDAYARAETSPATPPPTPATTPTETPTTSNSPSSDTPPATTPTTPDTPVATTPAAPEPTTLPPIVEPTPAPAQRSWIASALAFLWQLVKNVIGITNNTNKE